MSFEVPPDLNALRLFTTKLKDENAGWMELVNKKLAKGPFFVLHLPFNYPYSIISVKADYYAVEKVVDLWKQSELGRNILWNLVTERLPRWRKNKFFYPLSTNWYSDESLKYANPVKLVDWLRNENNLFR